MGPIGSWFVRLGPGGSNWWVSLVLVGQIGPCLVRLDPGGLDVALVGQGLKVACWYRLTVVGVLTPVTTGRARQ